MLEIARNFEQVAARFNTIVLIGSGLAAVVLGLFVWLGGLGFRRVLAGIIGAIAGGVCGFIVSGKNIARAGFSAIVGAIIAVTLQRILVTGSVFWRCIWALCCATLGTMLIFAGMILLLLYKGAVPINHISSKQSFYTAIFIIMTAFGTIEQLLLCRRTGERLTRKNQEDKSKQEPTRTRPTWRTS